MASSVLMMVHQEMAPRELVTWLLGAAALQERHPFHSKEWPTWVPGWEKMREHAVNLGNLDKPAESKDTGWSKKLEEEHAAAIHTINCNADYLVLRAKIAMDDGMLYGMGYEVKEKTKRSHVSVPISKVPLMVRAERGSDPGTVKLYIEKDYGAGLYQVQFCKGEPTGEESWHDLANFKTSRPLLEGLERACWYYFRVRSHGNNETSPWSAPVAIIVV